MQLLKPLLFSGSTQHQRIWIGTWSMSADKYGACPSDNAKKTLQYAFDIGLRCFDTASFYGRGLSERYLAAVFKDKRKHVFYSSKGGLFWRGRTVYHDASPEGLRIALETSLKNLQTDYLDLFSLHWLDLNTPLSESIGALKQFKKEGLIRQWGLCNLSETDLLEHVSPNDLIPHQVAFHLLSQNQNVLTSGSQEHRTLNMITSPFYHGLLLHDDHKYGKKDHRYNISQRLPTQLQTDIDSFYSTSGHGGLSKSASLLNWYLKQPYVDVVIPGPRHPDQIREWESVLDTL